MIIDFDLSFHRNHQFNSIKPCFPVARRNCFQIHICQMDVQYQTYIILHKSCELSKKIKKQNNHKILWRFESPFLRLPTGSTGHGRNCFGLATKPRHSPDIPEGVKTPKPCTSERKALANSVRTWGEKGEEEEVCCYIC